MQDKFKDIIELAPETAYEDPWTSLPDGGIVYVRRPQPNEIAHIYELTQQEISEEIAPFEVVEAVFKHNRDSFWAAFRASDSTRSDSKFVGYYGLLHLNDAGRAALERNDFDTISPSLDHIVPSDTRPSAIYIWAIVARKYVRSSGPLVAWALGHKLYGGVPVYATAGTPSGLKAMKAYGFFGAREPEAGLGHLFRFDPPSKKTAVG